MPLMGFPVRPAFRDTLAFCVLAAAALAIGSVANLFRAHPLPSIYRSREVRLDAAVREAGPRSSVAAAKPRRIELDEFQRFVTEQRGPVLDARSEGFYRLGHVTGALNLSREAFEKDYAALRPALAAAKERPIAVYCSGSDCEDSELVAEALLKLGFTDVIVYPEGWEEWTAAGLPRDPPVKGVP